MSQHLHRTSGCVLAFPGGRWVIVVLGGQCAGDSAPPKHVSGGCDYAKGSRLSTCVRPKRLPEYEGIMTRPNSR